MKKLTIFVVVVLLLAMTVVPAFAAVDGPPPDSAGCKTSSIARSTGDSNGDILCFPEPDSGLALAP